MKYEDAYKQSLEYFNNDELAAKVFLDKYALRTNDGELLEATPYDMHVRIAKEFARIESKKFKNPLTFEEIFELLDHFKYIIPQGSPMYGIGNTSQYVTLSNCYVVESPLDSYGSILETDAKLVQISKRRGGVGTNLSNLRPLGTATHNSSRTSTGICTFAERYSNTIREVGQDGRRGALMLTCDVHHPEVERFATCKRDRTKVTGANISILLTDEFLNAVKNDVDYEQRWSSLDGKTTIKKMVSARKVWRTIIENAHADGEPGLLFWDKILLESPADCYGEEGFRTTCTNPCSELPLPPNDSCRLLLLNLFSYVVNPFTPEAYFDIDLFKKHARLAQRLMDDLIDLELESIKRIIEKIRRDPEPADVKEAELNLWKDIYKKCEMGRRTGTGITALGDAIAALNIRYGSDISVEWVESIYYNLKLECYRESVEMAKEIGPFPIWNEDAERNNLFLLRIRDEDPALYADMQKWGRRNIALLTTAPAGSVSIETQTSSGFEPVFMLWYTRRKKINPNDQTSRVDFVDQNGDKWQEFKVFHPKYKMWMEVTGLENVEDSPYYQATAEEIDWKQRVRMQAVANRHVDHAISSTINLPEEATIDQVAEIYETAWEAGCKGITVYRKNCRTGVLVEDKPKEKNVGLTKTEAPKRPTFLQCDVYNISVKGKKHVIVVGLWETGEPYEVFAYEGTTKIQNGRMYKRKRGNYDLISANNRDEPVTDINELQTDDQEALTRMVSTALRHGADISFVVHQLEKVRGDLQSMAKGLARVLKKYIPDGTEVKGEVCSECGSEAMVRAEGCVTCKQCGWSKCS